MFFESLVAIIKLLGSGIVENSIFCLTNVKINE